MSWQPVYEEGVPVRMRHVETPQRRERKCPRTFPHPAHGPWFTGEIRSANEALGHDCPGVPVKPTEETE